jgi:hypothetical protein
MKKMKNNRKATDKTAGTAPVRVIVHYDLRGEEAERFLNYMRLQHLKTNAVAGRKLTLERLEQVEAG